MRREPYLLTTVGFVVVSGLTVPAPPPEAMQANELPLTHAINCSAQPTHESDEVEVEVAALAAPARPASTNAISSGG